MGFVKFVTPLLAVTAGVEAVAAVKGALWVKDSSLVKDSFRDDTKVVMFSLLWSIILVIILSIPMRTPCSASLRLTSFNSLRKGLILFLYFYQFLFRMLGTSCSWVHAEALCNSLCRSHGYPHLTQSSAQSSRLIWDASLFFNSVLERLSKFTITILYHFLECIPYSQASSRGLDHP